MALDLDGPHPTQLLLSGLRDAAVTVDGAGRITAWNAAAALRFGVDGDASRGRRPEDLAGDPLTGVVRLRLEPGAPHRELIVWPACASTDADVVRLQREDAIGRLAGGIAHDLANSLGAIVTFSTFLDGEPGLPADLQGSARMLRDSVDRTLRVVRGLLEVARHRPPAITSFALGPLVRETIELAHAPLATVEVRVNVPDALPHVTTDPWRLRQAVLALTVNAIEAMGGRWGSGGLQASGRFRVSGRLVDGEAPLVRLAIEDGGPAIPESARTHLFVADPPAGTPRAGRDLATAAWLMAACGGRLIHEAVPDGNRFVIELPVAGRREITPEPMRWVGSGAGLAEVAVARQAAATEAATALGSRVGTTVLVCDDEESIRVLLARVIERSGFRAIQASGGVEALERLADDQVDMVIADHHMAGMTGVELYRAVATRHPDLRRRFVMMSGDPDSDELVTLAADAGIGLLGKPFAFERIGTLIRETLRA
jgi:signal transduction histidine kinase/CheY-like chemotaxis protein